MNTKLNNDLIVSDIALTYYDRDTEVIKEIDSDFYCTLKPFSNSFYTLYLVGDMMYTNKVKITFELTSNETNKLDVRTYAGEFNYNLFDENTNSTVVQYASEDFKYTNAIPLNIRLTSNAVTHSTALLNITIEVLDV